MGITRREMLAGALALGVWPGAGRATTRDAGGGPAAAPVRATWGGYRFEGEGPPLTLVALHSAAVPDLGELVARVPEELHVVRASFLPERDVSTARKVAAHFDHLASPVAQGGPPGLVIVLAACATRAEVARARSVAARVGDVASWGAFLVVTAPAALARALVEGAHEASPLDAVVVVPHPAGRGAAGGELLHRGWTSLVGGLYQPGLVGYHPDHFRAVFSRGRRFALGLGRGPVDPWGGIDPWAVGGARGVGGARAAARALAALRRWAPPAARWRHVQLGVTGGTGLGLDAVNQAAVEVAEACESAANLLHHACLRREDAGRVEVAVLASSDP